MIGRLLILAICLALTGSTLALGADVQVRRGGRATAPPAAAMTSEAPEMQCPAPLGFGVQTKRMYCDVLTGRDPADGIRITLPPHIGDLILTFDLHNRHLYSEELVKTNRAYRQYTATIGVMTPDITLLTRAIVQNEFRTASDLVDRIGAEAGAAVGAAVGAATVKAVAPTGSEPISLRIAAGVESVSILGERLTVIRPDSAVPDVFVAQGRPIAVISNVMVEYRAAPVRRPAPRRR